MSNATANYTDAELKAGFDLVANPKDWRAPIDAMVPASVLALVRAAVAYYTGTTVVTVNPNDSREGGNLVRVLADGYRNGPCGP